MELESTLVMAHLQHPEPAVIEQGQEQLVRFAGTLHAVSPYVVASQRLTVALPSTALLEHTRAHPVAVSGSRVTYGWFDPRGPWDAAPLTLRFKNHSPFLHVLRLERDIVVSHW